MTHMSDSLPATPPLAPYLLGKVIKRGTTCIFDGAPYVGKTLLMMQYLKETLATPRGTQSTMLDLQVEGGLRCAYVSTDKVTAETWETAKDVGLDLKQLAYVVTPGHRFITENRKERKDPETRFHRLLYILDQIMADTPDLDLVIIEAFSSWLGCDLNSLGKVSSKMEDLVDWNERFPAVAVLAICHAGKARSDYHLNRAIDRSVGSIGGLKGFAGATMVLEDKKELDASAYRLTLHSRHGPPLERYLDFVSPTESRFQLIAASVSARGTTKGNSAEQLILSYLSQPRTFSELRDHLMNSLNSSKSTAVRAIRKAMETDKLINNDDADGQYRLGPPIDSDGTAPDTD